jgi:alpha-beta hydrolase superfamily lysophospholipase
VVIVEDYALLSNGFRVFYRCWLPDNGFKTLIIGSHGFTANSGIYFNVGLEFASLGYGFCMHDQRGHGRTASDLDRGYVNSFNDFLEDLESFTLFARGRYGGEKVVLLGHSMGGLIVLLYAGKIGRVGDAVVGCSPAVKIPVKETHRFLLAILSAVTPRKKIRFSSSSGASEEIDKEAKNIVKDSDLALKEVSARLLHELLKAQEEFWKYVSKIRIPVLLVHGKKDNLIPVEASVRTYESLRTEIKELKTYEKVGHNVFHEPGWREIIRDIAKWVENFMRT